MAITEIVWTDIDNEENGLSVRTKLNNLGESVALLTEEITDRTYVHYEVDDRPSYIVSTSPKDNNLNPTSSIYAENMGSSGLGYISPVETDIFRWNYNATITYASSTEDRTVDIVFCEYDGATLQTEYGRVRCVLLANSTSTTIDASMVFRVVAAAQVGVMLMGSESMSLDLTNITYSASILG